MAYPFVPAAHHYGPRLGPALAFVVHMAEGGGTVGFLSRPNARGVSVHYVIEAGGRIVQMVHEDQATGSINPRDLRDGDDPNGFYGQTTARACLGGWYSDPNAATITLEMEGFARDGPNGRQAVALVELTDDVRTRFPRIGLLGHRDFQDYKPCPGKLIPWELIGGHGPAGGMTGGGNQPASGDDMRFANAETSKPTSTQLLNVGAGSPWLYLDGSAGGSFSAALAVPWIAAGDGHAGEHVVLIATGAPYADKETRPTLALVKSSNVPYPAPAAPPAVDCDDVVTIELDKAAVRASDAVKARP
jgi:hypothetical protein